MTEIDASVLKAAGTRDVTAMAKVIAAHGHWLRTVIAAHVPPGWALQRAEQLAWLAIMNNLPHRDPHMHLQIWMLQQARVPITHMLNELDQLAVTRRDTLAHAICAASMAAIEDGSYVPAGLITDTLKNLPQDQQELLYARYRHGIVQSDKNSQIATKLCNARIACDWINASATPFTEQGIMSRLLDEWLMQTIDADSRGLLTVQFAQDLGRSAALIQQQRVHGALYAACHPFPDSDVEQLVSIAANGQLPQASQIVKQTGSSHITTGGEKPTAKKSSDSSRRIVVSPQRSSGKKRALQKSSSDRYQVVQHKKSVNSYMLTHIAGGAIVIIGVVAMLIFNNSHANIPEPQLKLTEKIESTSPIASPQVQTNRPTISYLKNNETTVRPSLNNPDSLTSIPGNNTQPHLPSDEIAAKDVIASLASGPEQFKVEPPLDSSAKGKTSNKKMYPLLFEKFNIVPKEQVREIMDDGVNGKSCLEVLDVPSKNNGHLPAINARQSIKSGHVTITYSIKIDEFSEVNFNVKQDSGGGKTYTGPSIYIAQGGKFASGQGRRAKSGKIPLNTWVTFTIELTLGDKRGDDYLVNVKTQSGEVLMNEDWPYRNNDFTQIDILSWTSHSEQEARYRISSAVMEVSE